MFPLPTDSPTPRIPSASNEAGFSIIEGLIAALLLLVVTLGILPLFSRAMNNNVKGNDSTRQSNGATDAFETSVALPFNSGAMTVPGGGPTSVVVTETLALKKIASPSGGADMTMSTRWELPADLGTYDDPGHEPPAHAAAVQLRRLRRQPDLRHAARRRPRSPGWCTSRSSMSACRTPPAARARPYRLRIVQAY